MAKLPAWTQEFPVSITVCDKEGIILFMNNRAIESFSDEGGAALIGTNLLDCHPPRAALIVKGLLATGRSNTYTIEKEGKKKLIFQSPWYEGGSFSGLVEIAIPLPEVVPHFVRE